MMNIKEIIITNSSFKTIAKLSNKIELDKYLKNNPNTYVDNISIDNICFYGFDELELFFDCKTKSQFFKLIN